MPLYFLLPGKKIVVHTHKVKWKFGEEKFLIF